jgi:hypothetical protein
MLHELPRRTWTCAVLILLLVVTVLYDGKRILAQTGATSLFPTARRDFLVPDGQPNRLASADLDGDGKPDLIVSCGSTSPFAAHFYRGLGNGGYQDQGPLPLGGGVLAADMNNDGKLDLVSSEVGVALGNGNGSFQPVISTPISGADCRTSSDIIEVGDFNKDGKLDVVVAAAAGVIVLLGNGNGTFHTPVTYSLDGAKTVAVIATDLDQDGNLDLIAATSTQFNRIYALTGRGDGTFETVLNFNTCAVKGLTTADFDRDGAPDVAAVCFGFTNSLQVIFGDGAGSFLGILPINPLNVYAWSVKAADFNHDGIPDLVVAGGDSNSSFGQASVLIGRGDGTFLTPAPYTLPQYTFPQGVAIFDADGNGTLDITVGNRTGQQLGGFFTSLSGVGDGTFLQPPRITGISNAQGVTSGDFNLDGNPDFVVANYGSADVSVFLGNGNGTFQAPVHYPTGMGASAVVSGDFNKDGKIDLAVANQYSDTISILTGIGNGSFVNTANYTLAANFYPSSIVAGDFNNDGKPDLAVEGAGSLQILPGNGDGTFLFGVTYSGLGTAFTSYLARYFNSLTVGDFNRDGKLDIAALSYGAGDGVTIFLGNGNFTFRSDASTYLVPTAPAQIVASDFNNDGIADLAVVSQDQNTVSILIGVGNGRFQAHVDYRTGFMPVSVVAADFNRDGKMDLAVANLFSTNVSILLGNGNGTFGPPSEYGTHGSFALAVGDWNKDGAPDLIAAGNFWATAIIASPPTGGTVKKVRGQLISD